MGGSTAGDFGATTAKPAYAQPVSPALERGVLERMSSDTQPMVVCADTASAKSDPISVLATGSAVSGDSDGGRSP